VPDGSELALQIDLEGFHLDDQTTVAALRALVREFVSEREWQPFHNPKNLSGAIAIEAAELMEIFQWLTAEQSAAATEEPATRQHLREEIADVIIYCLALANVAQVDLSDAIMEKMARNAARFPVEATRGRL
jgi:dCTP diphosphatase